MGDVLDLVIVGSGPAGLCGAIYAQRARLDAVVLEQNYISGGQVVNTYEVDNYPGLPGVSGMELSNQFRAHAEKLGTKFVQAIVKKIETGEGCLWKIITDKGEYLTKSVILAAGAVHSKLGVAGEEELAGMGVSYCATCDGAFFKNRVTAVVGGGDVAVEDAIFLARGCKKVYVVHRRDELRAAKSLQEKLLSLDNVEMVWNSIVEAIEGDDMVSGIRIKDKVSGDESVIPVDGVFIAVGIQPNVEYFQNLVDMDERGYIIAGEDGVTSQPGIFAAGDIRTKGLRQIITAASDGANAVTSVQNYLVSHF